ncbi:hypothetical protein ASPZODRAFT_1516368 [Penicilliopsis zonata CBS 506.65]|uniref:Arrestin-like N-terminal domain-containing protein n=1 Tax=Penicilliopsis zonata CBS 506.65 TaxID=1073090 RepID=A0A1L9SM31_9EURO|nr:hypothetical protein ASPZODRAFT_1516368 [Penicilliopsis zonata CBS 506.65]OJJ48107.1 hypothetical protein ASPZODRAFT_1516368 [Penicilliopsis zonata CBS 506.65]
MSATIHLDRPHTHFTNLDIITGKVLVHLISETSIGGIQVKLEGESKTRLAGPRHGQPDTSEKKRTELEVHKILYKVLAVFPTPEVLQAGSPGTAYTFAPGTYEYPFRFKFPFNNACSSHNSMLTNLNITGLKFEVARDPRQHVKKTLPPSLSSFPGEAEIKYYVKATIIRPQFYKENIRAFAGLNFFPIEPPRTRNPREETYARRQHQFSKPYMTPQKQRRGLFTKASTPSLRDLGGETPRVAVDARLPNPSILTCNEPIPLRVLVKQLSGTSETIFLQMLQIELIGYTHILAHDLTRTESSSWVILSRSNICTPLGKPTDAAGTEWSLDGNMWNTIPLPNTVAPSFETCNITRSYELEVRVGLSYGQIGNIKVSHASSIYLFFCISNGADFIYQPQVIVLPLRMPVKVYSGIAPPQALLDALAEPGQPSSSKNKPPDSDLRSGNVNGRPPVPPRPGPRPAPAEPLENNDDAPPSYEDAMAESLGPVDGPRRDRNPAAASSSESFDMLPSTPPESHSGSPPMSPPAARPLSTIKVPRSRPPEDNPPQYQPTPDTQPQGHSQTPQRRPSMPTSNLGVPNRKPLPRSSSSKSSGPS